jgi:hypothetical protein
MGHAELGQPPARDLAAHMAPRPDLAAETQDAAPKVPELPGPGHEWHLTAETQDLAAQDLAAHLALGPR